jgi:hypothetical protein
LRKVRPRGSKDEARTLDSCQGRGHRAEGTGEVGGKKGKGKSEGEGCREVGGKKG